MNRSKVCFSLVALVAMGLSCGLRSFGQIGPMGPDGPGGPGGPAGGSPVLDPSIKRTYVPLGRARGLLYEPVAPGEKSHIGVFVMHSHEDYLTFSPCTELSKRGYTVLCAAGAGQGADSNILEAKSGVDYLKKLPGIKKTILFGHSGGATLMTTYQEIAENGAQICQGPEKIIKCGNNLTGLQAADGVVLADANWGNAVMALFSIDPAVIDDEDGAKINPELDLTSPANGFNPKGISDYSPAFIQKFQKGTAERAKRLLDKAQARLALIEAGKGRFMDDEPFVVAGAGSLGPNNKLFSQDPKLMEHTVKAWPLLHGDGTITTEIVHTVRPPLTMRSLTPNLGMGAINTTVKNYLKNSIIRVTGEYGFDASTVHGVEWTSSYSTPVGNAENIHVPMLILGMTGSWEYLASESIYNHAASKDKTLGFVEGATHNYSTCKQCEKTPGQFGDTMKTLYDYVDKWIAQKGRFTE